MGCLWKFGRIAVAALLIASGAPLVAGESPAGKARQRISFNRDIRPILSDNCFACHGPDHANRQAGLRLDVPEEALRALDSGTRAIVPEDPGQSELLTRVASDDPDLVMPPPEAKLGRLPAEQVELLQRWIAEGAAYEPHWAFVPPALPDVPPPEAATVSSHPIDRLVSAKLARRGLALAPEADKTTLIRRASFDITGLPPTPEEVRAFLADAAPDAYEKLLDRLLASPRYGERMAADWMDLARYSDSYGFQVDRERPDMWPWRDWVIQAFNDNLPWDRFTTWQLAGDLLPDATPEQVLATAFNRLHQQESEGGSVEEEYRVTYVNDRVTTFGTAFLGLTLECCRCHDHKFDPLSQKEFYQLFAFFDDIDEAGLYSFYTQSIPTPKMRLHDGSRAGRLAAAEEAAAEAAEECRRVEAAAREAAGRWSVRSGPIPPALDAAGGTIPGEIVHYSFDERDADGKFPSLLGNAEPATSPPENEIIDDVRGGAPCRALRLTGDHPVQTPVGNFRRSRPFTATLWLKAADAHERAVVFHRSMSWTDAASRGYELLVADGHLRWSLIHFWPGDAASVRCAEPLPVGKWVHVAVSSDGSGKAAGLRICIDGKQSATEVVRDGLTREITGGGGDHVRIGERNRDHGFKNGLVDDFRLFDRELSPLEVWETFSPGTIRRALSERRDAEAIGGYFASAFAAEPAAARRALEAAMRARDDIAEEVPEIMVMRDLPQPKTAYVLSRGDYDKRGEAVRPDTPAVLPPFPAEEPRNRLGLARWLTHPDHPLLGRVTVNRLWQSLFGLGLVKSPEDLGSQAARPEYPEVLDWLAWSFSHPVSAGGLGWDMKALVRTIMTSQTYRQRSIADAAVMADDPLNAWLARGPRHRLPAEMIRDGALFATGLLVERIGGPPVKTYDIPESFKPAAADTGESLYRRSLYTFWRRSGPAPVLESFDVPKRVVCVAKRDTTNTPLHAFVLLNGPQFVEAARVLSERMLSESAGDAGPALDRAFELLTCRPPDETERKILRAMHADQLAWYRSHPDDAGKLVAVGDRAPRENLSAVDVAAAASVVSGLMNLDASVVKR